MGPLILCPLVFFGATGIEQRCTTNAGDKEMGMPTERAAGPLKRAEAGLKLQRVPREIVANQS